MGNFSHKVRLYLEANGKTRAEIGSSNCNVILYDDGSGPVIQRWDEAELGFAKPTNSQLDALDVDATASLNLANIRAARRVGYKEIRDQLDQLYHDMTAGKLDATGEWHKAVKAVKDANPKS